MGKLAVFIDESGAFSYANSDSYVGGWVCHQKDVQGLGHRLRQCVNTFNNQLGSEQNQTNQLLYPDHLHFVPLLYKLNRKGTDATISIDPILARQFIADVLAEFRPLTLLLFRSQGKPVLIPHEQAAYMDILRHTLVQLLDEPILRNSDGLQITLASRRQPVLYGFSGFQDPDKYEQYMAEQLAREMKTQNINTQFNISICFSDGRTHPGLILADFFCGTFRKKEKALILDFPVPKIFRFQDGYRHVALRPTAQIRFQAERDPVGAAFLCAEAGGSAPDDAELAALFSELFIRLDGEERKEFADMMRAHLEREIGRSPGRYGQLMHAAGVCRLLRNHISNGPAADDPAQMRLLAEVMLTELRIASHSGAVDSGPVERCLEFLNRHGSAVFGNALDLEAFRLEAALIAAQVTAFNRLRFNDAERMIRPHTERYRAMVAASGVAESVPDEHLARLEGTVGQLCAFLYELTNDPDYGALAEDHLKRDAAFCLPRSNHWRQAMGYLTVLYWKRGDLNAAMQCLAEETEWQNPSIDALLDLNQTEPAGNNLPFGLLHRFSLVALAKSQGREIRNMDSGRGQLQAGGPFAQYPRCLSAKWLAILYALHGLPEDALTLVNGALEGEREFTVELVRLPLRMLRHHLLRVTNRRSTFQLEDEVRNLDARCPGARAFLEQSGIGRFNLDPCQWSVYDIGSFLPFYYS